MELEINARSSMEMFARAVEVSWNSRHKRMEKNAVMELEINAKSSMEMFASCGSVMEF
jgi:hypothetical protein